MIKSLKELYDYVESKRNEPFAYGINDCFTFVSGALVAIGHKNHATGFKYKTLVTGLRQMKRLHDKSSHIEYFESIYEETPKAFAKTGDIAIVKNGDEIATGIVLDENVAAVSQSGLTFINILDERIIKVLDTE